jgi:hypothetical protein
MDSFQSEEEIQYNKLNGLVHKYKFTLEKKLNSAKEYGQYVLFCSMFGFVPIPLNLPNPKAAAAVEDKLTDLFNSAPEQTDKSDINIDLVNTIESKDKQIAPVKSTKSTLSSKPVKSNKAVLAIRPVEIKTVHNPQYTHTEVFYLGEKETYDFILNKDPSVSQQSFLFKKECEKADVQLSWMNEKLSFGLATNNKKSFDDMKELLLIIIENAKKNKKTIFKKVFTPGDEAVETFITNKIDIGDINHNAHTFMLECKNEKVDFKWNKEYGQFIIESRNEEKFNEKCEFIEKILITIADE